MLTNEFVGDYVIGVTAFIKNETYSEFHTSTFTLTVRPRVQTEIKPQPPKVPFVPEVVKNIKEKNLKLVTTT